MADCARVRGKIKNETFNSLKNFGTHLEHNFGHGHDTLSMGLVVRNLLAFAMHAICDMAAEMEQRARERWHETGKVALDLAKSNSTRVMDKVR